MGDIAEEEIAGIARKYALKNASEYGAARHGPVLSKLLSELPEAKADLKRASSIVDRVTKEVNSLPKDSVEAELLAYTFEEKRQRVGLPELDWADGAKVNTRFAPNPSGFMHIGHAKPAILCDEYSKMYNGSFYIRFEDTDPKTKKPVIEAYDSIVDDVGWLKCRVADVIKQSGRMELYYRHAEELVRGGKAYVCTCNKETMQDNRKSEKECQCRNAPSLEKWKRMFDGYKGEEATLRLKTDMHHPNSSIRDWVMFRIIDEEHPITGKKYRVWPLYNFASVIDDHALEINLVIRGKEHELNQTKQSYLYAAFGWKMPHILEIGALRVKGGLEHKSDIRLAINEGRITGWDDPRAPTVKGFRKRGISPEAIRAYIIASGTGKSDSYLDMRKLEAFDRKFKASVA